MFGARIFEFNLPFAPRRGSYDDSSHGCSQWSSWLLISGSQVRSLSRPPPSLLFSHLMETVEKGPLLAGFFVSAQTDPGLRSRKCGDFDPWSPVPKFPFLAASPWSEGAGPRNQEQGETIVGYLLLASEVL
jgi:hypothetical protein